MEAEEGKQAQTEIKTTDGQNENENGCGGGSADPINSSDEQPSAATQDGSEQKDDVAAVESVDVEVEAAKPGPYDDNETFQAFVSKRLSPHVSTRLMQLIEKGFLTAEDIDDRVAELLATFPHDYGDRIMKEIEESQLYGVQNKPQYLVGVMRHYKDRIRTMGDMATDIPVIPGPSVESIKELVERTGYQLEVTVGQRKYYNPSGLTGESSGDSQSGGGGGIYIGQIPRDVYEDTLIPVFETVGQILDLRVMMDPANATSKGYAFVTYCDKTHSEEAAKKYDGYEICPGKTLKVNVSVANTRLFVGNIPKSKSREEILEELKTDLEGVRDVIVYGYPDGGEARKNRGFCFVDFTDHKAASDAKRKLLVGKVHPWGTQLQVDWAEQQDEPDEETMAHVKVLYVRMLRESVTEPRLQEMFSKYGTVEKVKKLKDYGFIHFTQREEALKAMEELQGTVVDGAEIEISLAKPQGDQKQKKRLALKRGGYGGGAPMGMGMTPGFGGFHGGPYPLRYPLYGGGGYGGGGGGGYSGRGGFFGGGPLMRGGPRGGAPPYRHSAPPYPPYGGGFDYSGGYDAYGGGYGGGYGASYDDTYGGDGGYGGYGSDSYYGPPPYDPYGQHYPPYGSMRGGYRGRGGYPGMNPIRPMGMGRGGRGVPPGRGRGVKRPGGESGGPSSKRGGGRPDDFASDISMNMF